MRQADFTRALLNPDQAVPQGLSDAAGRAAGKRFDVYRNNVASGLTRVLEAGFPVVQRLVGAEFFAAMAGVFLRQHPPKTRIMMLYGDDFPRFLASFPPVAHLGYLPDVAQLEQMLRRSYHAEDAHPSGIDAIAGLDPDTLLSVRFRLSPSLFLVRSRWPILSIWRANMLTGAAKPEMRAEDVVILRPEFDPVPHLLPDGGADFLAALMSGQSLGTALDASSAADFDLTGMIGLLLRGQGIVAIEGAQT